MLVHLVRPLVRTQLQILARTPSADSKLTGMVAQWLGYLGVHAEVTQLKTSGGQIEVSLKVARPEQCTETEWQQILGNMTLTGDRLAPQPGITYRTMSSEQKVHRLLACVLRASNENLLHEWEQMQSHLAAVGLDDAMLQELRSAIRVPMPMSLLVEDLEPEVASFALSKAIAIALIDQKINRAEDDVLKTLLDALQTTASV